MRCRFATARLFIDRQCVKVRRTEYSNTQPIVIFTSIIVPIIIVLEFDDVSPAPRLYVDCDCLAGLNQSKIGQIHLCVYITGTMECEFEYARLVGRVSNRDRGFLEIDPDKAIATEAP